MGNPVNAILNDPPVQAAPSPGDRALEHFLAAGFVRIEPPILHPAAIFLDMSGEEIRGRLFLTNGASGEELCLRPEYTIPVCRAYLASPEAGRVAEYSYLGPVFRAQAGPQAGQGGERIQTGLESFGRKDAEAADAEIFALAMEAASEAGGPARRAARRRPSLRQHAGIACAAGRMAPSSEARRRTRAKPLGHPRRPRPKRARAARRAGRHGKRGPRRGQGAGRGSARDRRHRRRRRTKRRRDRRSLPRAGGAAVGRGDRSREAQGARSLSRDFRRSRRGGREAARARQ